MAKTNLNAVRDNRRLLVKQVAGSPYLSRSSRLRDMFVYLCTRVLDESADEIHEPNDLVVRFWNDGQLRHNYNTDDMEHRVPELVEFASAIMTLNTGDLIACGTNHEGLGALQDGETVEIEIERVGRMSLTVADPFKRSWERGIYMGADSTNPEAVKRHRPPSAT